MNNLDIVRQQRDILFNACKSIVKDKKCPDWISKILSNAAMNAKKLQNTNIEQTAKQDNAYALSKNIELGAIVRSNVKNDRCLYKITNVGLTIDSVQLYDVTIVKGDDKNPEGHVIHNVPATMLVTSN